MKTITKLRRLLMMRVPDGFGHLPQLEYLSCADGLKFSMQASEFHYCAPRTNRGPWKTVELGFPNRRCPSLKLYAEDWHRPTKTVYGWVPLDVVAAVIDAHGGLKNFDPGHLREGQK